MRGRWEGSKKKFRGGHVAPRVLKGCASCRESAEEALSLDGRWTFQEGKLTQITRTRTMAIPIFCNAEISQNSLRSASISISNFIFVINNSQSARAAVRFICGCCETQIENLPADEKSSNQNICSTSCRLPACVRARKSESKKELCGNAPPPAFCRLLTQIAI